MIRGYSTKPRVYEWGTAFMAFLKLNVLFADSRGLKFEGE